MRPATIATPRSTSSRSTTTAPTPMARPSRSSVTPSTSQSSRFRRSACFPARSASSRARRRTTASARTAQARWTSRRSRSPTPASRSPSTTSPPRRRCLHSPMSCPRPSWRRSDKRALGGILAGVVASALVLRLCAPHGPTHPRLVAEGASAPQSRIAIHYAPSAEQVARTTWRQLFAVLPPSVEVDVEVARQADFDRFTHLIAADGHLDRLHPDIVGAPITTWSRDRYAALVDEAGHGSILAPPRLESPPPARAAAAHSPYAISQALYHRDPTVADIAFEGGDLAATPSLVFADVNLIARNAGPGDADRTTLTQEIRKRMAQRLVFLGNALGAVPRHPIMKYKMP